MTFLEWLMLGNLLTLIWISLNVRNGLSIISKNQVATYKAVKEIQSNVDEMSDDSRA